MANYLKRAKAPGKVNILNHKNSTSAQSKGPAMKSSHIGLDVKNCSLKVQTEKAQEEVKKAAEVKRTKQLLPPLMPKPSEEPTHSKVAFQAPVKERVRNRRLSIPVESFHQTPHKPILKKRNSICTDMVLQTLGPGTWDAAALWSIPWEREIQFPHAGPKGLLLFHDEDTPVPPVQRRLSLVTKYSYSQEFTQALTDLQSRPASRH